MYDGGVKVFASYALAIIGAGMILLVLMQALAGSLKYPHGRLMLINMLRTNPNKAEQLCFSMPNTFFSAIGAVMKALALTGSRDPKLLSQTSVPTYDGACMMIDAHWKGLLLKVKMGAMAGVAAFAIGLSGGVPPIPVIILALFILGAAGWLVFRKSEVDSSLRLARAETLPEVERAFVDGRYVKYG